MNERPIIFEKPILDKAVKILAVKVKDWLGGRNHDDRSIEQIEKELDESIVLDKNAYQTARVLECCHGYSPDVKLVNILDSFMEIIQRQHDEAVAEWVKANNINPEFKIGDTVYVAIEGIMQNGEILGIVPETGKYLINVPCLDLPDNKGIAFPYEDVFRPERR